MNIKKVILNELLKEDWYIKNPITLEQLESNFDEHFNPYEYDKEFDRSSFRWWDEITCVKKIGDKWFQYTWAKANRDEHIYDLGWNFPEDSLIEVEPYEETITTTKYKKIEYPEEREEVLENEDQEKKS